jgi:hypothetical protein
MKIKVNIEHDYKTCPVCKGSGKIETDSNPKKIKEAIVVALHAEGYSHRQIMRIFDYKSPRSIAVILEKYK